MGAKTWMIAYVHGEVKDVLKTRPQLDREASRALAARLFPQTGLLEEPDSTLHDTAPRGGRIVVGCFPGLNIVAAEDFAIEHPSRLSQRLLDAAEGATVYLHAMHSVVDWFAYAVWRNGSLVRSLSLAPDNGVIEDIGERLPFEKPFWDGERPIDAEGYPFSFHPLDLGEEALFALFGFRIEGLDEGVEYDPGEIPLCVFRRKKPWWRLW